MKFLVAGNSPRLVKMIRRAISDSAQEICACADGAEVVARYAAAELLD